MLGHNPIRLQRLAITKTILQNAILEVDRCMSSVEYDHSTAMTMIEDALIVLKAKSDDNICPR